MKKVTSRMVAAHAGVSQSTVSKAINNNPEIPPETRRRVIRAGRELGYPLIPRHGRRTIAIVIPSFTGFEGYVGGMLSTLTRELHRRGMRQELIPGDDLALLDERCIDGGISIDWRPELGPLWGELLPSPLVRINSRSDHAANCYSIVFDGEQAVSDLVARLWKLGHRRIGFFFMDSRAHEDANVSQRLAGFLSAVERRGIPRGLDFCEFDCLLRTPEELAEILGRWRKAGVTALIGANEIGNALMYRAAALLGLRIPQDLSVVGWEFANVSQFLNPPLSTLALDREIICREVVDLLERLLRKEPVGEDLHLPFHYIERESVAPPAR